MKLLVGNWKMAPEKPAQAVALAQKTLAIAKAHKKTLAVALCVPSVHLASVAKIAKAPLTVGAQSVSGATAVAATGMINAAMLKGYGAKYCIAGHSESRARGETNDMVAEQVLRLLEKQLTPILCVGEKSRDAHGWYLSEVKDQLEVILSGIPNAALKKIVIAYEPVWAIGADAVRVATPAECQEMIIFIRKILADHAGEKVSAAVPVLYGGSVNEENASSFITEGKAQGFLVGRVSLDPKRFSMLAKAIA